MVLGGLLNTKEVDKMSERIVEEIKLLKQKYSNLQNGQNNDWVMIPDFPLVDGYDRKTTRLLILIPVAYPNTAPDNFYVDKGLRLSNGAKPSSYNEETGVPVTGEWGCYSWHQDKEIADSWNPNAQIDKGDNLLTFVKSINIRLREIN